MSPFTAMGMYLLYDMQNHILLDTEIPEKKLYFCLEKLL